MKSKIMIFIVVFLSIFSVHTYAETIRENEIIRVGVYEYEPYFMVNANGQMNGYYYDFMKLLQEKHHFEYEFVIGTLDEGLKKLADHEIDIMLGICMEAQLDEEIIFNRYSTNQERFGVFSKENIKFQELHSFVDLKMGMVEADANAEVVSNLFEANQIDVCIIYEEDYKTLENQLEEGEVDLIIENKWKAKDYFLVYEFIGRDVYIAGHKESRDILNTMDSALEQIDLEDESAMTVLHNRYFGGMKNSYQKVMISIASIACSILAIGVLPLIKKKIIKNKIKRQISKNRYILHYQPIYNPRKNRIVGFEGLLRLLDKNNKPIPPLKFIRKIEENDMLFEVSIWIIKRIIRDYDAIKNHFDLNEGDFYVSMNVSLKEIENDQFVDEAISVLKESQIGHQKICLEIIERFKMNDEGKSAENIKRLKQAGFRIAIDDFGVEYSNLDIFQKLDVDIIKVDKTFVDGIGKDAVKEEIVLFISKMACLGDRCVVLEGVEEADQDTKIKEIENDKLYVQGYYYDKPMSIEAD